jgi:pyruvate/2-oxoglutarate dehydrogenase complex dihydrolipoamide dehydrogenase (E3) component
VRQSRLSAAGLRDVPFLTSDLLTNDEPMEMWELPRSLIVLGGGYIALELGQMFHRFGVEVTILQHSAQLLAHGYEPEVGETLGEVFEKEGINVITGASVRSVRQEGIEVVVEIQSASPTRELRAEKLLVATSRRPKKIVVAVRLNCRRRGTIDPGGALQGNLKSPFRERHFCFPTRREVIPSCDILAAAIRNDRGGARRASQEVF